MLLTHKHRQAIPVFFLIMLGGCTNIPVISRPPPELPESFVSTGQQLRQQQWWLSFNDENLNALMNQALSDSFNLQAAVERMRQADALAQKAGAGLQPSLDASFQGNKSWQDSDHTSGSEFQLMASYEIDLWSRVNATKESARFDFLASREDLHIAAISITSEVANQWYSLRTWTALEKLYGDQTTTLTNQLSIIDLKYRFGQTTIEDVLQQKQHIEKLNAQRQDAINQQTLAKQQLALLLGKSDFPDIAIPDQLPELPGLPATGVPAELAKMRPDLKKAWYQLQGTRQGLIVAEADRMPQLNLTASLSSLDNGSTNLFNSWVSQLTAGLVAPLFDGGAREAEVERQQAAVEESVNLYSQSVLTAFTEIETALVRESSQQQQIDSITVQLTLARQTEQLKQSRYRNGDVSFLDVLTSQNSRLDLEQQHVQARGQLLAERIGLQRSLAGNLSLDQLTDATPEPAINNTESQP